MLACFNKRIFWVVLLLGFFQLIGQININFNEDEQKKQAEQFFKDQNYGAAFKIYQSLLANYPKDPKYIYRVGVCVLFVGDEKGDRKKAIGYLESAKLKMDELDKEVVFYLGKAYHLNYRFDDALRAYAEYKSVASLTNVKKFNVNREIESAKNGRRLLGSVKELMVLERKRISLNDYQKSYDQSFYGGNLLVKPDEFMLGVDKKKNEKFILFQKKDRSVVLFSSYENEARGKDIYMARRLPNGNFGKPFPIPGFVNTEFDEDYPYLHPNEKELYFSSKGHNSMGGYDIFKSIWNDQTESWGNPENLDFPINTPADDIQFVSDSLQKMAIFSSTRISEYGKIDVYKINIEPRQTEFALIAGNSLINKDSKKIISTITVKDIDSGENVGVFNTEENGDYKIKLPNGGKFIFTVSTPGYTTQSEQITIPISFSLRPYKQVISYQNEKLLIQNFFDAVDDEKGYESLVAILQERADMNPNADKFKDNVKNETLELKNELPKSSDTTENKNLSNGELLEMAKDDLATLTKELEGLKKESTDATNMAINIDAIADQKQLHANEALAIANSIVNQKEKDLAVELADEKKQEALVVKEMEIKAQNIANKLKVETDNKAKEVSLQQQFVNNLDDVNKSPSNQIKLSALQKTEKELKAYQEKIKKEEANDLVNTTNAEITQKQIELDKVKLDKEKLSKYLVDLNLELTDKQNELKDLKDKDLKETIRLEIQNLNTDKKEKEKAIKNLDDKILTTEAYIDNKKSESSFENAMLDKVKRGDTDISNLVAISSKIQNKDTLNISQPNYRSKEYQRKEDSIQSQLSLLNVAEKNSSNLDKKLKVLKVYNEAIDERISNSKESLLQLRNEDLKAEINGEIQLLQIKKDKNEKEIGLVLNEKNTIQKTKDTVITLSNKEKIILDSATNQTTNNLNKTRPDTVKENINTNNISQASIDDKNASADNLQNEARKKRIQAKSLSGAAKTNLITEAIALETKARNNRTDAISAQVAFHEKQLSENKIEINFLKTLSQEKTGADLAKTQQIEVEVNALLVKSVKMRAEANKEQDQNAKIGALINADELEREVIIKQNQIIEIYQKLNPNYIASKQKLDTNSIDKTTLIANQEPDKTVSSTTQIEKNEDNNSVQFDNEENVFKIQLLDLNGAEKTTTNLEKKAEILQNYNIAIDKKIAANKVMIVKLTDNSIIQKIKKQNIGLEKKKQENNKEVAIATNDKKNLVENLISAKNNTAVKDLKNTLSDSEKVKNSVQYKKYTSILAKVEVANANVKFDKEQAKVLIDYSNEKMKAANSIRDKANGLPTGTDKNKLVKEANELESESKISRNKADSLIELASNTSAFAIEQQATADEYVASLDKKVQKDILELNKTNKSSNTNNTIFSEIPTNKDSIVSPTYSSDFSEKLAQMESDIISFKNADKSTNQIKQEEVLLNNYLIAVNKEIANQTAIKSRIKNTNILSKTDSLLGLLTSKKNVLSNIISANKILLAKTTTIQSAVISNALKVNKSNSYSTANPIPKDKAWPNGIVYAVQIGAFKKEVPNDAFKGLTPIVATTSRGFICYQAGQFNKFDFANSAKNDVRKLGFIDAFVVVYKNGLRISLAQAELELGNNTIKLENDTSIPVIATNTVSVAKLIITDSSATNSVNALETSKVAGLFYTVQIGVYSSKITSTQLLNLSPINREQIPSGNFRYSAGIYNDLQKVKTDRLKVYEFGIKDAFVTVYHNGKKITFAEADQLKNSGAISLALEKPIIFPNVNTSTTFTEVVVQKINATAIGVKAFTNNIVNDPIATKDNGIKLTNDGIVYKVQIGAYSKDVPDNISQNWLKVKEWPIRNYVVGGLYIYTIGSFSNYLSAIKLMSESVGFGMNDAFITVFKDGTRLYAADASQYMK